MADSRNKTPLYFEVSALDELFASLKRRGFRLIGPTLRDQAIVYDSIESPADLPLGWTDEQEAGSYRLRRRSDNSLFGYAVGPHSWKRYLWPPRQTLFEAQRKGTSFAITEPDQSTEKTAFIGVRSCELQAMQIQDRIFLKGPFVDQTYEQRRSAAFIVAVNCSTPAATCFCTSMKTGPKVSSGFDIALTEVVEADRHFFLATSASVSGAEVLQDIVSRKASADEKAKGDGVVRNAERNMGRNLDTSNVRELLLSNPEHSRWQDVASRCLSCGNCTMVCPTCFCSTVDDVSDLQGETAERNRRWDSCFNLDFSYLGGGHIRKSTLSRYRQWLTHKFATWIDQFGTSGCVGCGRCITWCPVGIDVTEEIEAIRDKEGDVARTLESADGNTKTNS